MKNNSKMDITKFAKQDSQNITSDWIPIMKFIDGVQFKEIKNVAKESGYLTEIFRSDWGFDNKIEQVFQVAMFPGSISGWHVHKNTTDRLFVNSGLIKIVLYDGRIESPTFGLINEFRLGTIRAGIVIVPKGVWHAVQNLDESTSLIINMVDYSYKYENPDHLRLPIDTELIPYKF